MHLLSQPLTLRDALHTAVSFDVFNRHADKVVMANVAQTINCLHSLFLASGDRYTRTPVFHVFEMYQNHMGAQSVELRARAEQLNVPAQTFDAVICECAFCTFPDKTAAAGEFARILRPGGRVALSDLTRTGPLPPELEGLLAWIACIADARPVAEYAGYLEQSGFQIATIERHDQALAQLISDIRGRLLGTELMVRLKKLELPFVDFSQAQGLARAASEAVRAGTLGYSLVIACRIH